MGRINNKAKYPVDTNITREDYWIGSDFEDSNKTKNFVLGDVIDFIATETSDIGQNNRFIEISAGTIDEGDSVADAINALTQYEILDTELSVVEDTEIAVDRGGFDTYGRYLKINKGKNLYGLLGDQLVDGDMLRINPIQPETIRNTDLLNSLYVGNSILSGTLYWIENYDFGTGGFKYISNFQVYKTEPRPQEPITLSAPDGSFDRIDSFAIDITTNTVVVVEGTPSASPLAPIINYNTQIFITNVLVETGTTQPSTITSQLVFDENAGEPTEWTASENTGGARIDVASTNDPDINTISIEGTNLTDSSDTIEFLNDVTLPTQAPFTLNFRIKNKTSRRFKIEIFLSDGASVVSQPITVRNNQYGYSSGDTAGYQTVDIQSSDFGATAANFDKITFAFKAVQGSGIDGFFIDNVRILQGINPPINQPTTYIGLDDTTDLDYIGKNTYIPSVTNENGLTLASPSSLGLIQNLQEVTDVGATTTNIITIGGTPQTEAGYAQGGFFVTQLQDLPSSVLNSYNVGFVDFNGGAYRIMAHVSNNDIQGFGFDENGIGNTFDFFINKGAGVRGDNYGSGTLSGTPTFSLAVDSGGNFIETALPTGATGLEAIDEGNGTGWRLIGKDAANYGNIGAGATDLSDYFAPSTDRGATGQTSFAANSNVIASGQNSVALGGITVASGVFSMSVNRQTIASGGRSFASGLLTTASGDESFVAGHSQEAYSFGEAVFGVFATTYTPTSTTAFSATDRVFTVGVGANGGAREDVFRLYKNSVAEIGDLNGFGNGISITVDDPSRIIKMGDTVGAGNSTGLEIDDINSWVTFGDFDGIDSANIMRYDAANETLVLNTIGDSVQGVLSKVGLSFTDSLGRVYQIQQPTTPTGGTSLKFPDGGGADRVITISVGGLYADTSGNIDISSISGGGTEIIDETSGDGLVITGRVAANYGNVGLGAVSLSTSNFANSTTGATGNYSFAAGLNVTASGTYSFAHGQAAQATGNDSFAFGTSPQATAAQAVAIGNSSLAEATETFALGLRARARVQGAVAWGTDADAQGRFSYAFGLDTVAYSREEFVLGAFGTTYTANSTTTWDSGDRLLLIANGTATGSRSDAFTILKDGRAGFDIDNFEANVQTGVNLEVAGAFVAHKAVKDDTATTYNFVLTDRDKVVTLNNASAVSAVIPANASVAYPIGTQITVINKGAGTVTLSITTDTLNQNVGGLTMAQYDKRVLTKITATSWILGY